MIHQILLAVAGFGFAFGTVGLFLMPWNPSNRGRRAILWFGVIVNLWVIYTLFTVGP